MSTGAVTPLRHRMIEDMNARKLSAGTQRLDLGSAQPGAGNRAKGFARLFGPLTPWPKPSVL